MEVNGPTSQTIPARTLDEPYVFSIAQRLDS